MVPVATIGLVEVGVGILWGRIRAGWAVWSLIDLSSGVVPASVGVLMVKSFHVGVGWAIGFCFGDLDGIVPAAIVLSDGETSSFFFLESDWIGKFSLACTSVFFIWGLRTGVDSPSDGRG